MIDHIYLPVTDIDRSLQFYTALLTPLDFAGCWDFKGQDGWPDLYGFGGTSRASGSKGPRQRFRSSM
jgi:catechol 2,3-dioxygenase-like lactoylglutathione lyase family enzyme